MKYWEIIKTSYSGYAGYMWKEITNPNWNSFFWWVIGLSLFFFALELVRPWRKNQAKFRKDFWLDLFYIFFNFFLFSLVFWKAAQDVLVNLLSDFLGLFGVENLIMLQMDKLPVWAYFLILFVVGDFVSWWVHRMLHYVPWMWNWHKVHHSVEQMGFAAHVRYHWMENVVYWTFRFLPLTILGADLVDIFAVHVFNTAWGHFNHTNITVSPRITGAVFGGLVGLGLSVLYLTGWPQVLSAAAVGATVGAVVLGPYMRYIFNSPEMHIWHHSWELPQDKPYGVNFGITLGIWDYIFGTAWVPRDGRDIRLGFPGLKGFPTNFLGQITYGFGTKSVKSAEEEEQKQQ